MAFAFPTRKQLAQSPIWNLFLLTLGGTLFSFGAQAIAAPHGFLTGGVYGTGLLAWYASGSFTPAIWYALFNIPLFAFAWFQVGKKFLLYSLYGSMVTMVVGSLIDFQIPIKSDLYASVAAGIFCGAGIGLQLRTFGCGGGLDLVGVVLNRKWNVGLGRFSTIYNSLLFLAAGATISLDLIIVSFIQVFISSTVLEYVLRMFSQRKMVYVVSERGEEICEAIIAEGHAGATVLKGRGAYSGDPREIILTVTNNVMLRRLENLVFDIDEKALFIVENTFYVSGARYPRKSVI